MPLFPAVDLLTLICAPHAILFGYTKSVPDDDYVRVMSVVILYFFVNI